MFKRLLIEHGYKLVPSSDGLVTFESKRDEDPRSRLRIRTGGTARRSLPTPSPRPGRDPQTGQGRDQLADMSTRCCCDCFASSRAPHDERRTGQGARPMLISLTRKFIFVANLKTASTAIEAVLRPRSHIALVESRFGKHMPFRTIERRFGWVFDYVKRQEFLVFGVIRDPVDFVISLYNSHMDPKFKSSPQLFTGDIDFEQFLDRWAATNHDQLRPQFNRFVSAARSLGANYLISYEKLSDGLNRLVSAHGIKELRELPKLNVSKRQFS